MARYELRVNISIRQNEPGGYPFGSLTVDETLNLDAASFLEVATILSKFDELAKALATPDSKVRR